MNKKALRGSLCLLLGAFIWGCAFVAQRMGMDHVGPFTFNAARGFIGGLTLLPFIAMRDSRAKRRGEQPPTAKERRLQTIAGICAGFALFVPATLQQVGLQTTSAGKAGFITAMYIVVVPILSMVFGKRAGLNVWISVALAVAGLYFLCMTERLTIVVGDAVTLVSVVFWAVQIMAVDYFAPRVDCIKMSCVSFFISGLLSMIAMFIFEQPSLGALWDCIIPLLYTGVLSSGVGFTLQAVGQKDVSPTVAAVIMSLESVFAALAGFVIQLDRFTARELLGFALMLTAVILAQIPFARKQAAKTPAAQ